MIRLGIAQNNKEQAQEASKYIIKIGKTVLETAHYINDADRAIAASNLHAINRDIADLIKVLSFSNYSDAVYEIVTKLMLAAFLVGTSTTFTPEAEKWRCDLKSFLMRQAKASNDAAGKREAVDAILNTQAYKTNPNVSAEAIFAELKGSVSLSTVKRRLRDIRATGKAQT